jgi:hypothetical protein
MSESDVYNLHVKKMANYDCFYMKGNVFTNHTDADVSAKVVAAAKSEVDP